MKTKNFPTIIYAVGNISLLNSKYTVGIVGSRNCTEYGRKVASEFAEKLSKRGICVISGMAIGIDGIAHNAAILGEGKTVAVLGGGFNHIFPPENEWLFHKILENGGCIISEYPPETEPDKNKFPIRNRIISGLSDAVLVVEATHRSGSTITAKYSKEEGKPVFAVPNDIYTPTGVGTNRLIQGGAILATEPDQIMTEIGWKKAKKSIQKNNQGIEQNGITMQETAEIDKTGKKEEKEKQPQIMPKEYLEIYRVLSNESVHINEISKKLKRPIQEVNAILTMMEIEGYAYQSQTSFFRRNV